MNKTDIVIWYRVYLPTGGDTDIMMKPLDYSSYSNWADDFTEKLEEINFTDFEIVDYDYIDESSAYSIYLNSDTWDAWNNFFDLSKEYGIKPEALSDLIAWGWGIEQLGDVLENAYEGHHDNMRDFAQYIVDEQLYNPDFYEWSFDYEWFGRELSWDIDNMLIDMDYSHEEAEEITNMRDEDLAEWYIEMLGGFDQLGKETIAQYQDVKKIERNLDAEGYYEIDGHIFRPY
tara:strand:- start:509 stop:1201 length:693 start_codon:yes stop_codon:yes gene_type:complete